MFIETEMWTYIPIILYIAKKVLIYEATHGTQENWHKHVNIANLLEPS